MFTEKILILQILNTLKILVLANCNLFSYSGQFVMYCLGVCYMYYYVIVPCCSSFFFLFSSFFLSFFSFLVFFLCCLLVFIRFQFYLPFMLTIFFSSINFSYGYFSTFQTYVSSQQFFNSINLSFIWVLSIQFSSYFVINVMLFDLVSNFKLKLCPKF